MTRLALRNLLFAAAALLASAPALLPASDRLHPRVLAAFREVVSAPAKSTVQVYCDGYRSALGTIIDPSGYIVTKASELKGKIECQLHDARKLEATIVAKDQVVDLAMLKVDAKDLPVVAWSDGDKYSVGSWVATPGLTRDPVAIGVLSVGPRKIPAPSGALGIQLEMVDRPARIEEVMPDSAAQKAGLKVGDIILKVDGKEMDGRQQLVETIRGRQPGEKVELSVKRGEESLTISATLGSFSQLVHGDRADFQNSLGGSLSERRAGFPSVIQHDSILKPTECGGPLVDLDGKAIGLNIARAGRVESYALPATVVKDSVKRMLETHLTSASAKAQ